MARKRRKFETEFKNSQTVEFHKTLYKYAVKLYLKGIMPEEEHFGTMKIMLRDRNALWLEKLMKALENQDYEQIFLAGGVTHFIGYANLLDMLKEAGFAVRPVTCPEVVAPLKIYSPYNFFGFGF